MTDKICGVDVASETLDARVGQDGPWGQFANSVEGSSALHGSCQGASHRELLLHSQSVAPNRDAYDKTDVSFGAMIHLAGAAIALR